MSFLRSTKGKIILIAGALLIAAALILSIILLSSGGKGYRNINVTEIAGTVTVGFDGKEYSAYENMHLSDGYSLTTETESYTRLSLDNDKYVKLEEISRAIFTKIGRGKNKNTRIELEYGTLITELTKPLLKDESYVVNTPNSVLAVRGTMYKVVAAKDKNGVDYTDIYTYGGSVAVNRIKPDGSVIEENVLVKAGYKTRIRMDPEETVYIEEYEEELGDNVDPIDPSEIPDEDLVAIYDASQHGHKMFMTTEGIWNEIDNRNINVSDYRSVYDGGSIIPYGTTSADNDTGTASAETTAPITTTEATTTSAATTSEPIVTTVPETTTTAAVTTVTAGTSAAVTGTTAVVTTIAAETTAETTAPPSETTTAETTVTASEATTGTLWSGGGPSSSSHSSSSAQTTATAVTTTVTTTGTTTETTTETTAATECEHDWKIALHSEAATCTKNGREAVYKCSKCGETSGGDVIPATGEHVWSVWETVEPDCENSGYRHRYCVMCRADESEDTVPALGHDMVTDNNSTVNVIQASTCTADGLAELTTKCSRCGKSGTTEAALAALGHNWELQSTTRTCTSDGVSQYSCSRCSETKTENESALGGDHSWGDWAESSHAPCEPGTKTRTCSRCGASESEDVPASQNHVPSNMSFQGRQVCQICGSIYDYGT